MNSINRDEEYPERETEDPRIWGIPKIQYQLGSSEVGRDGDGVVEPIIPGKSKSVSWGKESGGVGIERPCIENLEVSMTRKALSTIDRLWE